MHKSLCAEDQAPGQTVLFAQLDEDRSLVSWHDSRVLDSNPKASVADGLRSVSEPRVLNIQ